MKTTLFAFTFLLSCFNSYSQNKTFIKEYTYKASEADSKVTCRAIAVNQLRSMLLDELGVYVESTNMLKNVDTNGKDSQQFADSISTISAGITKLDVLAETWNGELYWMKASITVDTTSLATSLKRISDDHQKMHELQDMKQRLDDANKKLNDLTQQLDQQKELNSKITLSQQYNKNVNEISATNAMYNAKAKYESKDFGGAISDFDTVISLDPKFILAYAYRGHSKIYLNDYNGAIIDFNKAIELNPKFDAAYVDRGRAKDYSKDYRGAIDDFTKAIQISPDYANAYNSRGEVELKLKNYEAALNDFDRAIKYNRNYGIAYFGRGIAKNWLHKNGACDDWNTATRLNCAEAYEFMKKYCR